MTFFESMQQLSRVGMQQYAEAVSRNIQLMQQALPTTTPTQGASACCHEKETPCCPPKVDCPPHCLSTIERRVQLGERVVLPIAVGNNCGAAKTWRVGLRPFTGPDGELIDHHAWLSTQQVTVPPGRSVIVRLVVDLEDTFEAGRCYVAEVVLREHEINQNICIRLCVDHHEAATEVCPRREADYLHHFQSWEHHFYCETPRRTRLDKTLT